MKLPSVSGNAETEKSVSEPEVLGDEMMPIGATLQKTASKVMIVEPSSAVSVESEEKAEAENIVVNYTGEGVLE